MRSLYVRIRFKRVTSETRHVPEENGNLEISKEGKVESHINERIKKISTGKGTAMEVMTFGPRKIFESIEKTQDAEQGRGENNSSN